ncbi:MAG: glycosyltransferase family 39 protein [Bacteroidota bacterium]
MDKTEARYAEIARIMAETNDWIVPQIDYGVPFWGKPPLSTWLSAGSFRLFGVNEFTARLPYFLLSVLMVLMLGKYARRNQLSFWLPALVACTLPEFFLHAGVVSTDTALAFGVTLVMLSFWETVTGNRHWYWKYLFFVGIGIGLLAKGPIVVILTFPPLFVWVWMNTYFKRVGVLFPWFSGGAIVTIMVLPWYYFAEKQSPGFLDYFLFGEHFKRFFDTNWKGDRYGFPKSQPLGMIWVFLVVFALPWIPMVLAKVIKNRATLKNNPWVTFLLLWVVWTPLFFSFSKSLIHPYIMPIMTPLALLLVFWWKDLKFKKAALILAAVIPVLACLVFGYAKISNRLEFYANTDKYLVIGTQDTAALFHFGTTSYSGQFYSKGRLKAMELNALKAHINGKKEFAIIIKNRDLSKIPKTVIKQLSPIEFNNTKMVYRFPGNDNASLKGTVDKD